MTPETMRRFTTPEQADAYWRDMGEPASRRAYLRTIYFNGEPVAVQAPCPERASKPVYPATETGD